MQLFALLKILPTATLQNMIFQALEYFVKRTDNKLDDQLVAEIKKAFTAQA
jgi:hypothetical protein